MGEREVKLENDIQDKIYKQLLSMTKDLKELKKQVTRIEETQKGLVKEFANR